MTKRDYSSRAQQTTLSGSLNSSATSTTVGSGANLMGGVTPATSTYTVVIDPDTTLEEIVDVTAVSGNILTITRGIDGSTGVAHSAGAIVRHMVTGRDLREANQHSENMTTAHGITLANIVKTTDTGTVTSTMLLDGTILNADINASAGIVDTKLATIATAGKVSNSATTATNANTASAIVARDASGNFSAGTITASLTGTASLDLPKTGGTMSGAIEMGTNKITGLGLATVGTDAASKTYVDGVLVSPSNLTGPITSVGSATSIASQTGTGTKFVVDTSPTIVTPTITSPTITGAVFNDGSVVFEGTTADAFETTLAVTDPTADRTITLPNDTGTVALTSGVINNTLLTTTGDIIYASGASAAARLGIGSTGQVLTVAGGLPSWATPASASSFVGAIAYGAVNLAYSATPTAITLTSEILDTNSFHDTVTNTSRMTIPSGKDGKYSFDIDINLASTATFQNIYLRLYKNGVAYTVGLTNGNLATDVQGRAQDGHFNASIVVDSVATDYWELFILSGSGTPTIDKARWSLTYLGA